MRYWIAALFLLVLLSGCSDRNDQSEKVNFSSADLPKTISYIQAIQACNLTNLTNIALKNHYGRWEWSLTFFESNKLYYCRVDSEGELVYVERLDLPNLSGIEPPKTIPLDKIRIDEHVAFETAVKNESAAKWLAKHKNADLDGISLESSFKVTLWRVTWTDEANFAVLMVAVNATSGEVISVRGAGFGD